MDRWSTWSASPNEASAAAESPPPTTVVPGDRATASATERVPPAKGSSSRPPWGRSRRTCPRADHGGVGGHGARSDVQAHPASGTSMPSRRAARRRRRSGPRERGRPAAAGGNPALALRQRVAGQLDTLVLDQRVAGGETLGAEEAEAHGPADEKSVGDVEEAVDQRDLVAHLGPAEHHDQRRSGASTTDRSASTSRSTRSPAADGAAARPPRRWRRGGTMHRAERVVHVGVGERGEVVGEPRIVRRSPPAPSGCSRAPGPRPAGAAPHPASLRPDHLGRLRDRCIDQLGEPVRTRPHRRLRLAALRPAEMRAEDQSRSLLQQQVDGGQGGADARVVGDPAVLERDVEVHAGEHRLPLLEVQIANRALAERGLLLSNRRTRQHAFRQIDHPVRSPTRCRTRPRS